MTYMARLLDLNRDDGTWHFSIVYSDGVTKVIRQHTASALDDSVISRVARATVAELESAATSVGKVTLSKGSSIDLTAPVITPVVVDPAQDAFMADLRDYNRLQRAVNAGVIAATDKRVADLAARLKSGWSDTFLAAM